MVLPRSLFELLQDLGAEVQAFFAPAQTPGYAPNCEGMLLMRKYLRNAVGNVRQSRTGHNCEIRFRGCIKRLNS